MPMELMNQDVRVTPDVEPLEIDAKALVDFLSPRLPHDPEVVEIADPVMLRVSPCAVCDGTQAEARYFIRGTHFRLVVCADCGLGTLNPKPTPRQIASFYPPEYYGSPGAKFTPLIEGFVRRSAARAVRKLTRNLRAGSRVLDVGCGRGVLLSTLADLGMEPYGFEISPTAALGADPRAKIAIAHKLERAAYPDGYFDLVVLCHVLEHLPDPKNTLLEIRRILKPGGKLAVSVPNFSSWQAGCFGSAWFHLDLPRHLFHFPAQGLRRLLTNTGFTCAAEQHFSLSQNPFGWVQSLLNLRGAGPRNSLYSQLKMSNAPAARNSALGNTLGNHAAYWLGMPLAVGVSLLSAAFRRGATVTIIAENPISADGTHFCGAIGDTPISRHALPSGSPA